MEDLLRDSINEKILENTALKELSSIHVMDKPIAEINYLDFAEISESEPKITLDPDDKEFHAANGLKNYKQVYIKLNKCKVQLSTMQVTSSISVEQIGAIKDMHNVDAEELTMNVIINEMSHSINKKFTKKLDELASKSYLRMYNKKDKLLSKLYALFNKTYIKRIKIHSDRELIMHMMAYSNRVAWIGRFGSANFIVCSLKTAAMLETNSQYAYAPKDGPLIRNNSDIHSVATMGGMVIYVDPNMLWSDNTVYIGRTPKDQQPGIHFAFNPKETEYKIKQHKLQLLFNCEVFSIGNFPETQYIKFIYKEKRVPWVSVTFRFRNKSFTIG